MHLGQQHHTFLQPSVWSPKGLKQRFLRLDCLLPGPGRVQKAQRLSKRIGTALQGLWQARLGDLEVCRNWEALAQVAWSLEAGKPRQCLQAPACLDLWKGPERVFGGSRRPLKERLEVVRKVLGRPLKFSGRPLEGVCVFGAFKRLSRNSLQGSKPPPKRVPRKTSLVLGEELSLGFRVTTRQPVLVARRTSSGTGLIVGATDRQGQLGRFAKGIQEARRRSPS